MRKAATANSMAEIGFSIKIMGLPAEDIRDCCNDRSRMGPRIMARMSGAAGKLPFRIKYPTTPKVGLLVGSVFYHKILFPGQDSFIPGRGSFCPEGTL